MLNQLQRIKKAKHLLFKAFGHFKRHIAMLTIFGFIGGLLEGIGINALIPLFSFVVGSGEGGEDVISQAIESFFQFIGLPFTLKYLLVFIVTLFILKAVTVLAFNYIKVKIVASYEEQKRKDLFNSTMAASWPHLLKEKLGYFETVIMTDVRYSSIMLERISASINIVASLIVYAVIAFNISYNITLFTLSLGGLMILLFKPLFYRTRMAGRETTKLNKDVAHYVNENIYGMKTVRSLGVHEKVAAVGNRLFARLKTLQIRVGLFQSLTSAIIQPFSLIFISIVFAYSYKSENFNLAALIAVMYLIQRIFQYVQQIQSTMIRIQETIPYLEAVLSYERDAEKNREPQGGTTPFHFNTALSLTDVSFRYHDGQDILTGVNFDIARGEMIGLIGPSGGGKTTLVDLLLRLFVPSGGSITLDGVPISNISLAEWRKHVGYVSQDVFLMNGTISENLRFYDDSITDADIQTAAELSHIAEVIEELPQKYETVIGERGIRLSVGQRQRIVLARILARNPTFLILDEATSALDNESEVRVQEVIEQLKGKVTVLAIAHRLSTLINSDRLLVLEGGKIVEAGAPKELLKDKESHFYKTYNIRK